MVEALLAGPEPTRAPRVAPQAREGQRPAVPAWQVRRARRARRRHRGYVGGERRRERRNGGGSRWGGRRWDHWDRGTWRIGPRWDEWWNSWRVRRRLGFGRRCGGVRWRVGFGRRIGRRGLRRRWLLHHGGRRWRHRSRRDGGGGVLVERHHHGHDRGRCRAAGWAWSLIVVNGTNVASNCSAAEIFLYPPGHPEMGFAKSNGGSCSVQVTQAAPNVGDILEGTFAATLADPAHTQTKQVTNGGFTSAVAGRRRPERPQRGNGRPPQGPHPPRPPRKKRRGEGHLLLSERGNAILGAVGLADNRTAQLAAAALAGAGRDGLATVS